MAEAHNANSVIVAAVAAAAIAAYHTVDLTSWTESAGYVVTQSAGVRTAWGVYQGAAACETGDHIEVCIGGPCKAWLDGAITLGPNQAISNDADAHVIAESTSKARCLGWAMVSNGATENLGEIFVGPFTYTA